MNNALVRRLSLDKLGDVLIEEVCRVQVEVLQEERTLLARLLAQLGDRIRILGGKRRGRVLNEAIAAPKQGTTGTVTHAPADEVTRQKSKPLSRFAQGGKSAGEQPPPAGVGC